MKYIPIIGLLSATIWNKDKNNYWLVVYHAVTTLIIISAFIIYEQKKDTPFTYPDMDLMTGEERAAFVDSITSN